MNLSYDIISQFAKVVNSDKKEKNSESTVYGVIVADGNGNRYVKLDGSDQLTPLSDDERPSSDSTTANTAIGDRVAVTIKNHTATITGNTSSPSVRTDDFDELHSGVEQIVEFDNAIIKKVQANEGYIKKLQTDKAEVGDLSAANAKIENLEANKASVKELNAAKGEIEDLKTKKLDAEAADIKYATIENLRATNANVGSIAGNQANFEETVTQKFSAVNADIVNLKIKKLDAEEAKILYADIDFANIGKAAIEAFYAKSGIIKDLVIGDTTVSGKLVGVTIIGDLIEGGTVKADKLVIQGTDGLYYKLNTDGMKTTAEQTEYNSLNGSIITAKTITAEKCNIHDLVAFDATIGGFTITDNAIYSGVKNNINTPVHGTYIDKNGQVAFGDSESYLKYYKDSKGKWKLEIAADNIRFSSSDKTLAEEVDNIKSDVGNAIASVYAEYYLSTSTTSATGGIWSTEAPQWVDGKYVWSRTVITYNNGNIDYSPNQNGVCIAGAKGAIGLQGYGLVAHVTRENNTENWWNVYGEVEHTESWDNTASIRNNCRVGDIFAVVGTASDTGNSHIAYYRSDTASGDLHGVCISHTVTPRGAKGDKGDTGKGVKSTEITYQSSTSGTTIPTGTWNTSIPSVAAGLFLWTRTVITYSDNTKSTSYSVGQMGKTGADGKGVKSTSITYQAGSSGTSAPTDTWVESVPATSALKPFLWTKTVITYTDNTKSTSYSVGSTPDSIQIGGRNLFLETGVEYCNNQYDVAQYKPANEPLKPGEVYTITLCVTPAKDNIWISPHVSGGYVGITSIGFEGTGKQIVSSTFTMPKYYSGRTPNDDVGYSYITLYRFPNDGTVIGNTTIHWMKIEKGNKATDWTPAPEDIESQFTETNTRLTRAETSISNNSNEISLKASTESLTELANKANQTDKALSDAQMLIQKNMDAIATLTSRDFKVEFTTITNQIAKVNGDLTAYKNEVGNWMRFDADGNLVLGATRVPGQDAYELKLTKNRISFMLNDNEVAYISSNQLYILNAVVVMNFRVGYIEWVTRGNGNTGLVPRYKGV